MEAGVVDEGGDEPPPPGRMNKTATSAATLRAAIAVTRGVMRGLAAGVGEEVSAPGLVAGGVQTGIPRAAQKSKRFLRLVATKGWPGASDATAIA